MIELPGLGLRALGILRAEGPRGLWRRAQRRWFGSQRQVFRDYRAWMALERAPEPGPRVDLRLSVVTPVCDPPPAVLLALFDSLRAQSHADWEWCVCDDGSRSAEVRGLLERFAADPRVRLTGTADRRGIAAATNRALALGASGAVAFVDHDDLLPPQALARVARLFAEEPTVDLVFSDEDKVDMRGGRLTPFFKPAFDPLLLLGCNYMSHFQALRRSLLDQVGGLSSAFDGSQDYDLALRATERARAVAHIPEVLYHWRITPGSTARAVTAKGWAYEAARRALEAALARRGRRGRVAPGEWLGSYRVVLEPEVEPARVSALFDGARPPAWADQLGAGEVLCGDPALAWPERRNRLAERARGEWLLFLGAARPIGSAGEALLALLRQASWPGVGFVSGKLVRRDGRLVELGLALGQGSAGVAGAPEPLLRPAQLGYFGLGSLPRSMAATSGEVLLVPRGLFLALGGYRPALGGAAGVELCWRGALRGARTVVTPEAAFQREPGPRWSGSEEAALRAAIPDLRSADPYFNPNFQRGVEGLRLASGPAAHAPRIVRASDGAWRGL